MKKTKKIILATLTSLCVGFGALGFVGCGIADTVKGNDKDANYLWNEKTNAIVPLEENQEEETVKEPELSFSVNKDTNSGVATATLLSASNFTGDMVIPSTYTHKEEGQADQVLSVVAIGDNAFKDSPEVVNVTIPEGVETIGAGAFKGCALLTSAPLPSSVKTIGDNAFMDCAALNNVVIGNKVEKIGLNAFKNCSALTSIVMGTGVTSVGENAFGNTGYKNNVSNWEDGVLYLGHWLLAAKNNDIATEYTIKEGVTGIAPYAFENCTKLTTLTIPQEVTMIDSYSFYGCAIKNATVPVWACSMIKNNSLETVTITCGEEIEDSVFENCVKLSSITIADSIKEIGGKAFSGTAYYKKASNWQNDVLYLDGWLIEAKTTVANAYEIVAGTCGIADYAFYDCKKLTSVTIPSSVKTIGDFAFYYCVGLTTLTVNGEVETEIGDWAFYNCSGLTTVTLGNNVTKIGSRAFSSCYALEQVSIGSGLKKIGYEAFAWCAQRGKLKLTFAGTIAQWNGVERIRNTNVSKADKNNTQQAWGDSISPSIILCSNGTAAY